MDKLQRWHIYIDTTRAFNQLRKVFVDTGDWAKFTDHEQAMAAKDRDINMKYVSNETYNIVANKHRDAMARIEELEGTISQTLAIIGPSVPKCCQGCSYEWGEALRILKGET